MFAMSLDPWTVFLWRLEQWGKAARGTCAPRGLRRPPDDELGAAPWSPDVEQMERLISALGVVYNKPPGIGRRRVDALKTYYVLDRGDIGGAIALYNDARRERDFAIFRGECERYLYDLYCRDVDIRL